jgi:hypothetical protein
MRGVYSRIQRMHTAISTENCFANFIINALLRQQTSLKYNLNILLKVEYVKLLF